MQDPLTKFKLLADTFRVTDINKEGRFFNKVSRIEAVSQLNNLQMSLDVNFVIYPMEKNEYYEIHISTTLGGDMTNSPFFSEEDFERTNYMDEFDYVVHGKIFKIYQDKPGNPSSELCVVASFGGLLMNLKGPASSLKGFPHDARIFLLIKKI
eukprot:TRINITY_DN0_c2524_g1_i4.p1 TRINITY_DN0_c2524_g1~~TRINITY_DN0_c2524_g1_i4.p1  ORF type:complete len:153 (+),score=35.00 TRINITY_DN0_c2524_g1_i4:35-493(+)